MTFPNTRLRCPSCGSALTSVCHLFFLSTRPAYVVGNPFPDGALGPPRRPPTAIAKPIRSCALSYGFWLPPVPPYIKDVPVLTLVINPPESYCRLVDSLYFTLHQNFWLSPRFLSALQFPVSAPPLPRLMSPLAFFSLVRIAITPAPRLWFAFFSISLVQLTPTSCPPSVPWTEDSPPILSCFSCFSIFLGSFPPWGLISFAPTAASHPGFLVDPIGAGANSSLLFSPPLFVPYRSDLSLLSPFF